MLLLHRYAFSVAVVALAIYLRLFLNGALGDRPFATFFFAVLLAAVVAGPGPAIVATLLSALYAIVAIDGALTTYGVTFFVFVFISLAVVALTALKDRAVAEAADAKLRLVEADNRRLAEKALRAREDFVAGVLDSLPHQIAVVDPMGVVLAVNRRWDLFAAENGPGPAAVSVGANYLEVCRAASAAGDPDASQAFAGLQSVLRGERAEFVMEYPCHAPERERWFMMHAASASCAPAAVVVTHTDITERMQTERQLRAATEELKRLDQRKDAFLATLAHELRNPLAPIRTAIPVLQQDVAKGWGERDLALLAIIERQVGNLVRLVDDLLDVSRFTKGKIELKKQSLDLVDALRGALEISRPNIEKGAHHLTTRFPDRAVEVTGDPVRLAQVFSNLLNNSAKYTDRGGEIALACTQADNQAIVTVSDNGHGISADMLPKVFDLFTQTDSSLGSAQGGLGIGLALVKTLVALHGGTVDAQSAGLGKGSIFTVRLPLRAPTASA
jgi:signal transduction histidine kinase